MTEGTNPPSAAAADLTPQLTVEAAIERRTAFVNDPALREQLLRGDPAATDEHRRVHEMLHAHRADLAEDSNRDAVAIADFVATSDLPPAVVAQVQNQAPVSAAEFNAAHRAKERAMADENFVRRYLSGDRDAQREMTLLNIILSSPIR